MKICDIVQAYTGQSGGIRTYIEAKRRSYTRQGLGEHVLIVPGARDACHREGLLTTYEVKGIPAPGGHPYRLIIRPDKVLAILEQEKPRLVELGSGYWLPWAAFRYRQRHGAAVVCYYHTDYPTAYVEVHGRRVVGRPAARLTRKLAERHVRRVHNRCDATIVATDLFRRKLADMGVGNCRTIPLGIDPEVFHPLRRERRIWLDLGIDPAGKVLLYSGRLDEEKAVLDLIAAHRMLTGDQPVSLVLVGDGPLRPRLEEMARRQQRLLVLPYQNNRLELARLFASADIYVTAGPHETFGLSVLEAQASGLPVVGVNAGALPERVPADLGFLARPGQPADLAWAVRRCLAEDPADMGRRARRLVESRFTWRHCFQTTFEFYRHLTGVPIPVVSPAAGSAMAYRLQRS